MKKMLFVALVFILESVSIFALPGETKIFIIKGTETTGTFNLVVNKTGYSWFGTGSPPDCDVYLDTDTYPKFWYDTTQVAFDNPCDDERDNLPWD